MKILLTGAKGMLGRTLVHEFSDDYEVVQTDLPEVDITNGVSVESVFAEHAPDAVIHCAAMTAVDKCETERNKAFLINETGTANVAEACRKKRHTVNCHIY